MKGVGAIERATAAGKNGTSGRKATWTAAALFRVEDGELVEFIKDWNKLSMWEQFGWPIEECLTGSNE